jgi:hypothetical protein
VDLCQLLTLHQGAKQEGDGSVNNDTEMADTPAVQSDDEGDEGDDGDEGDEGDDDQQDDDENGDDQSQDQDMDQSSPSVSNQPLDANDTDVPTDEESPMPKRMMPPMNPLNLTPPTAVAHFAASSPRLEGSPLKNVVLPSPTEASPQISPVGDAFAPAEVEASPVTQDDVIMGDDDHVVPPIQEATDSVPDVLPSEAATKAATTVDIVPAADAEAMETSSPPPVSEVHEIAPEPVEMMEITTEDIAPVDIPEVLAPEADAAIHADENNKLVTEEAGPIEPAKIETPPPVEKQESNPPEDMAPINEVPPVAEPVGVPAIPSPSPAVEAEPIEPVAPLPTEASPPKNETADVPITDAPSTDIPQPQIEDSKPEEDDNDVDLLGGLEQELDRQAEESKKLPAESAPLPEEPSVPEPAPEPMAEVAPEPVVTVEAPASASPVAEPEPEVKPEPLPADADPPPVGELEPAPPAAETLPEPTPVTEQAPTPILDSGVVPFAPESPKAEVQDDEIKKEDTPPEPEGPKVDGDASAAS